MTITRDHVPILAEKASSGRSSPEKTEEDEVGEQPRQPQRQPPKEVTTTSANNPVTLSSLQSLPENKEVTVYLPVVEMCLPSEPESQIKDTTKGGGGGQDHDKYLQKECPPLEDLIRILEERNRNRLIVASSSRDHILAVSDPRKIYTHPAAETKTTESASYKANNEAKSELASNDDNDSGPGEASAAAKESSEGPAHHLTLSETIDRCLLGKPKKVGENVY